MTANNEFYDKVYRLAANLEANRNLAINKVFLPDISEKEKAMAKGLIKLLDDRLHIVCELIAPLGENTN